MRNWSIKEWVAGWGLARWWRGGLLGVGMICDPFESKPERNFSHRKVLGGRGWEGRWCCAVSYEMNWIWGRNQSVLHYCGGCSSSRSRSAGKCVGLRWEVLSRKDALGSRPLSWARTLASPCRFIEMDALGRFLDLRSQYISRFLCVSQTFCIGFTPLGDGTICCSVRGRLGNGKWWFVSDGLAWIGWRLARGGEFQ